MTARSTGEQMKKKLKVGDEITLVSDLRTVRKIDKDGVWTGDEDKTWWAFWEFDEVGLARRPRKTDKNKRGVR